MKNCEKENFSLEAEELEIRTEAAKKRKGVFQGLRKKTLAILGSLFFSASSLPAVSTAEIVEQFKSGDKIVELDKSESEKEIRENIFEKQSDKQVVKKLCYIVEKIGTYAAYQLGCDWKDIYDLENRPTAKKELIKGLNQKPEIKEENISKEPAVMDSMKQIGLEPEIIEEVLKTFPPSWLKEISLITYLDKPGETLLNEETGKKTELIAHHQSKGGKNLSEIYFFSGAKTKRADTLLFYLIFEYSHANNWKHRCNLTLAQRISLLYEIVNRVESPDRYKDLQVESVKRINAKEEEIAKKSIEYWAAICMLYLIDPQGIELPDLDKRMVSSFLQLTDPKFDAIQMSRTRNTVILRYLLEKGLIDREALEKEIGPEKVQKILSFHLK